MIINLIKGSIKDCVHDVLCTFQLRRKEIIDFPTKTNKVQRDKLRHKRVICYLIRHLMGLTSTLLNRYRSDHLYLGKVVLINVSNPGVYFLYFSMTYLIMDMNKL